MCIRYNMDLYISMHIQNFIKIHPSVLKILRKNTFLHKSRAITLLFINEFSPFAIPNHSSLISMSMRSLKKISQKLFKLVSGNKVLTNRQTDKMVRRVEHSTRHFFFWQGIKIQTPEKFAVITLKFEQGSFTVE